MSTRKVFMQQTLESTEDSQIVPKTISSQVSSTEDLDGDPKLNQQIQDLLDRFETFGAAKVATKLYTPRKIGNASFDGSANISLEDIGALAKDASAESAVKLETARSINGTPFDGTQDINISRAYNLVLEGENYENANEIYTLFAKVDLSKLPDDKIARATMILSEIENSEGGVFLIHCKCMNSTPDIQAICLQSTIKNIKFGYYIDSDDNTLYYGMRLNQTYRPHTTVTVLSREYMVTNNYGNTNTIPDGWIDIEPRYNADISDLSQYIKKAGDIMSGTLESSKTTSTYLNGNKGAALINSLASAGAYTMLDKLNSTNGYFTDGVYRGKRLFNYTAKETVDGETNAVTKSLILLDEDGNSSFPGTLKATSFDGKLATARKIGNASFDASADVSLSQIGALPSANVMNTNTVTAAGYALDARQANPNVSGSLAAQIAGKLDSTAKATDSDKLDGYHYSSFAMVGANSQPTFRGIELYPGNNVGFGGYIDFHLNDSFATDYTTRFILDSDGKMRLNGSAFCINNGEIESDTGMHLIACDDSHNVYLAGGATLCMNVAHSAYKPIYASAFTQQSSRRVKTNIKPMSAEYANKLLDLDIVGFDYTNGVQNQYGLIAEDVHGILPNIVLGDISCDDNDTEKIMTIGIDYTKLIPLIIKKLQMQQEEIDNLNKSIEEKGE